jgi:hypothetical protein
MATQSATINLTASVSTTQNGKRGAGSIDGTRTLSYGTVADAADKSYYGYKTISNPSSPDALDFSGGGLIDLNGDTITWVEMTLLIVKAADTNAANIVVGGHASPFDFGSGANTITLQPGESKVLINTGKDPGYPITNSTADTIKVTIPSGTNQIYEILAVGRSA